MSIKDDIMKLTKPTSDPTTFPLGLVGVIVKMMLSISFDPLKGISIPGAEEFLAQSMSGFVSLSSPPVIRSLNAELDPENVLTLKSTVNVSSIQTNYEFIINKDSSFTKTNFIKLMGSVSDSADSVITVVTNPLDFGSAYYYKLILTNKNGTTISDIKEIGTPVRKVAIDNKLNI